MKSHLALAALLGLLPMTTRAQSSTRSTATNAPVARPQFTVVRSPEIASDRTVTFRLRAKNAEEVLVLGQWPEGRIPMARGSNDIWSVTTTNPVPTGVWEYSFQVDGLSMIDPGNPAIKPMREPRTSILHLPGNPARLHDFQDVPHGVVRFHTYRSQPLGRLRELAVYTPPGYDQKSRTRFPALFLQHGAGDNQSTWTVHGKAHWILDNLIAQGKARPMVVVMMDGHAATGGGPGAFQTNTALFERDLLEAVIPFIEGNYRVKSGAANRGIVGLSMGGGQSLTIGLNHADQFGWVGGFSSAVPSKEAVGGALTKASATNKQLRLLWIACGKDDFLIQRNKDFVAQLNESGVKHEWHLTEGNHSWPVWRDYLGEFLPRLFQ